MMTGKRWIALLVAGLLLFVSTGISFATMVIQTSFSEDLANFSDLDGMPTSVIEPGSPDEQIAILEVNGAIQDIGDNGSLFGTVGYSHQGFMDQLQAVLEDDTVKGVLLKVNSPGGGVVESAEIHNKLLAIKEAGKKIYVSMGAQATSGGYYIAAPADQIFATRETLTGSLGVIIQSINYSELAERVGIEFVTVTSGEFKDMLNPAEEVNNADLEIIESILNESYDGFVDVIANGRDLSEERVREIADGRIYSGSQALELDLIDALGYEEDALAALKENEGLENAQVIEFSLDGSWSSLFDLKAMNLFGNTETQLISEMMTNVSGPRPMYLYAE